jgi:heme/copper-type cytochrome/quinol oxidase subunit 2
MRRRWLDWVIGIALGLVIGLGVLVYFVFVHSEGTIDAPKINESTTTGQTTTTLPSESAEQPEEQTPTEPKQPTEPARQVPVVKVIGGAPPADAGPKQLTFRQGEKVRFEIETDEPFSFEIRGLNIKQSIEQTSIVSFPATKTGQFPVIASATLIGVADLQIKPRR